MCEDIIVETWSYTLHIKNKVGMILVMWRIADMFGKLQTTSLHKKIDEQTNTWLCPLNQTQLGEVQEELYDMHNDLTEVKEIADFSRLHLEDKSFTSTMNPSDPELHHHFAATKTVVGGVWNENELEDYMD